MSLLLVGAFLLGMNAHEMTRCAHDVLHRH